MDETRQQRPVSSALLIMILVIGLAAGIGIDRFALSPASGLTTTDSPTPQPTPGANGGGLDYGMVNQALNLIDSQYVDRPAIKEPDLTYGAISGMVDALGDTGHSRFMSPDEVKQENQQLSGQFEGIGVYVEMRNGQVTIVSPIDGTPAQKAGLKAGDIIVGVNGKSTEGQSLQEVVNQVLGPAGTQVTVTIFTPSTNNTRDVKITRARIVVHNVTWQMLPGTKIAQLRIVQFSDGVGKDVQSALQQIQQQGATGIILDLRNDPGGVLEEAVTVASSFLDSGNVLLEKDAKGKTNPVPVEKQQIVAKQPLVVLINQGSASASEIVAGALQDAKRATLVGETTFGTGTVLRPFPLSDGSELLLAIQEWLTPNGRVIWHQGIKPDQEVKLSPNVDLLVPESERDMTASQLQSSQDAQLLKGVSILSGNK